MDKKIKKLPDFLDLEPILSEKAVSDQNKGIYHFWVPLKATKGRIKKMVEDFFKVKVDKVNTFQLKGKIKTSLPKRKRYQLPARKKALVFLTAGEKIKELLVESSKKK